MRRSCLEKHTDVPALGYHHTEEEDNQEGAGADPAVGHIRGAFIEIRLIKLKQEDNFQPRS